MSIPTLESESKFKEAIKSDKVTIVHFTAVWSGPCRPLAANLDKVQQNHQNDAQFYKLDIDDTPGPMREYGVRATPTLISFKSGNKVGTLAGLKTQDEIEKFVIEAGKSS